MADHNTIDHTGLTGVSGALGRQAHAFPLGLSTAIDVAASTLTLAAVSGGNGGALAQWIPVLAPMYLDSYQIRQQSTASARTAEARLYQDNGDTTLDFVTGTDATWSFTPSSAGRQTSSAVSGAPVLLTPGWYLLVIRNTSASQTFQIGGAAIATAFVGQNMSANLTTASVAALGSTFDPTGLTKDNRLYGAILLGRVMGQGAAW